MTYWELFLNTSRGYLEYLGREITNPHATNYFYWLIAASVIVYAFELLKPWRVNQPRIRKDFWLDAFYMFFNFFFFSAIGFAGLSMVGVTAFNDFLAATFGIQNLVAIKVGGLPAWAQLVLMFVIRDFLQYFIHRLLHRVPILWEFHKVHHSVKQMGFAAQLRYHWMENVVYRSIQYLPLAMIGFGIQEFFIIHLIAVTIGHFNHANFHLKLGPLKYIFNNPQLHIWHHVKDLPAGRPHGLNFAISLSCWDYLFGTAEIPHDGRDIELGFPDDETFPQGFFGQIIYPLKK